ncbi:hypothetical protein COCMIDRAFT_89845 [Bipolaris oryzae ATCC 44560]|uniref:Endopolyphosphatase n=1 Tax=Bipolaris oryzae ATCC 44560 TaxID=930090 RepID=W6ZUR3_COCMI|nr:uncharacterized protein COCMIDRAFT_89845 [Bipolaris oryzae ATCC 44560]EUC47566.1 hypothetical protein COCMIDRAFT_89845 [Bipolaris oryzae ATCC 44560]
MLCTKHALINGLLFWVHHATAAPPINAVGDAHSSRNPGPVDASSRANGARRLTGRFLHITDFHPDPFYKTYSSTAADAACHRKRGPAGIYGAETTGCDSPFALVNQTFQWIQDNIKDEIDFIIWTGDSARHDNDEEIPRTHDQIVDQNKFMVSKFVEVFGNSRPGHGSNDFVIPIVPTFGNNDIMPHNIFTSGPNSWTMSYLDIWRGFIPEAQRHQFQQGGWFSVEVIPGKLAAISLNTMYFFTSNSAVDGCAKKHEPGYEHMEWLRIQLQILRERGMKAMLLGHVPPARVDSKESWDETCWQKYALFVRQFRDVLVGSLYGHMNIDHFIVQDFDHIEKDTESGRMKAAWNTASLGNETSLFVDGEVTLASASDYLLGLRNVWASLPAPPAKSTKSKKQDVEEDDEEESTWAWLMSNVLKLSKDKKEQKKKYLEEIGGKYAERYAVSHVSPSVVPNYFPTLRIIEYNISGLEHLSVSSSPSSPSGIEGSADQQPISIDDDFDGEEYLDEVEAAKKKHKGKKDKKGPRKYKFKVPEGPSKSAPPGPAYSPQPLTWTRIVQYYANLTRINNDFVEPPPGSSDGLSTSTNDLSVTTIFGLGIDSNGKIENNKWKEGKHKKHQGKQPRPEPHPKEFAFEVEYDTRKDKGFPDLTVRRWVEYARKIASSEQKTTEIEEEHDIDDVNEEGTTGEYDAAKGKGKKGKHHKHKPSKHWFKFVKRAFVSTMDAEEIKEVFGSPSTMTEPLQESSVQEVIEL